MIPATLDLDYWQMECEEAEEQGRIISMTTRECLSFITAAQEFQLLKKCNGEDVIGGHEPIWYTDCCPLCTQIGDNNELRADLRIKTESFDQLSESFHKVQGELESIKDAYQTCQIDLNRSNDTLRSVNETLIRQIIEFETVKVELRIICDYLTRIGTTRERVLEIHAERTSTTEPYPIRSASH